LAIPGDVASNWSATINFRMRSATWMADRCRIEPRVCEMRYARRRVRRGDGSSSVRLSSSPHPKLASRAHAGIEREQMS
jgi:hypothetical protein